MDVGRDPDAVAALAELAEIFWELVGTLSAGKKAQLPTKRIVATAGRCVRRSQAAALVVFDDRGGSTVAATADIGERVARIRAETGQGPSIDVVETNDLVICDDLTSDERWPEFARRVTAETGIRSIAAYRLYLGGRSRAAAALNFYSDWPYAFDELAISTGSIFASYCSLALIRSQPAARA